MVDKILNAIKEKYLYLLEYPTTSGFFECNIKIKQNEIIFYHAVPINHFKQFKSHVNEINFELLKYTQSNYFYKVIRMTQEISKKHVADHILIYINRIQLDEIEKCPKNAHLATIKNIKDLYV